MNARDRRGKPPVGFAAQIAELLQLPWIRTVLNVVYFFVGVQIAIAFFLLLGVHRQAAYAVTAGQDVMSSSSAALPLSQTGRGIPVKFAPNQDAGGQRRKQLRKRRMPGDENGAPVLPGSGSNVDGGPGLPSISDAQIPMFGGARSRPPSMPSQRQNNGRKPVSEAEREIDRQNFRKRMANLDKLRDETELAEKKAEKAHAAAALAEANAT